MKTTPYLRLADLPSEPLQSLAEINFDLLRRALALLGWREGSPRSADRVAQIDERIVTESRCPRCKRKRRTFHAWHRPATGYMAVSICQRCGDVEEI